MGTELVYQLNRYRVEVSQTLSNSSGDIKTTTGTEPLAINRDLRQAAGDYANTMVELGFFSHVHPATGTTANLRVRQAGYELASSLANEDNNVELLAGGTELVDPAAALAELLARGSHSQQSRREALLGVDQVFAAHREIGVGYRQRSDSQFENYWVIEIGHRVVSDRFLTGVVFADLNGNGQFDAGEGIGGVEIRSGTLLTRSDSTGAYSLRVGSGIHYVVASGDGLGAAIEQAVIVRDHNVQIDFTTSGKAQVNFRSRSLWTAPYSHLDVNQNGSVEPLDALAIINHLNRRGAGKLELANQQAIRAHIDTNGDQIASPLDALLVINYLNRRVDIGASGGQGESESEGESNVWKTATNFWWGGLWDVREEKEKSLAGDVFDSSLDLLINSFTKLNYS